MSDEAGPKGLALVHFGVPPRLFVVHSTIVLVLLPGIAGRLAANLKRKID